MNIPLEIVRAGKAEEYASAFKAERQTYGELLQAEKAHKDALRELFHSLKRDISFFEGQISWTSLNKWQNALVIEELAKELRETAGVIAEKQLEHDKASNHLAIINKEA